LPSTGISTTAVTITRRSFGRIFWNPLFIALGWDIYNREGIHENYRDVILEHALRVEKSVKAPDYCIRIGPVPKFFVEAKKPAVDIKSEVGPALSASAVRVDGEAAAVDPHRLRGIRGLRLPREAGQKRQRGDGPRDAAELIRELRRITFLMPEHKSVD
jgi:hypothetical protein